MKALVDTVDTVIGVDPHKYTHTATIVEAAASKKLVAITENADPGGFALLLNAANVTTGTRCWVIGVPEDSAEAVSQGC